MENIKVVESWLSPKMGKVMVREIFITADKYKLADMLNTQLEYKDDIHSKEDSNGFWSTFGEKKESFYIRYADREDVEALDRMISRRQVNSMKKEGK